MRNAFSLITAIIVIITMSVVTALIFNLTGRIAKETSAQYRKEQAILYARSYTEYAIMSATAYECPKLIKADIVSPGASINAGEGYRIRTYVYYIGNDLDLNVTTATQCETIGSTSIVYPGSKASIIVVDVEVVYKDPDQVALSGNNTPWLKYHKRTLQRL